VCACDAMPHPTLLGQTLCLGCVVHSPTPPYLGLSSYRWCILRVRVCSCVRCYAPPHLTWADSMLGGVWCIALPHPTSGHRSCMSGAYRVLRVQLSLHVLKPYALVCGCVVPCPSPCTTLPHLTWGHRSCMSGAYRVCVCSCHCMCPCSLPGCVGVWCPCPAPCTTLCSTTHRTSATRAACASSLYVLC
jgi:hypothetical protein